MPGVAIGATPTLWGMTDDWDAATVRALRSRLGLSQMAFAVLLNVRQQTISEWERGAYRPRGASARLLTVVSDAL